MRFQHIYIIGQGALGIMYGHQISRHIPDASLRFIADPLRIQRYQTEGVYCNGELCHFEYVWDTLDAPPADSLIFAVKANTLSAAIKDARFAVAPHTVVMSVLNGIASEEEIGSVYGHERVLPCVVQGMDATKTGNRLEYSHLGTVSFGEWDGTTTQRIQDVTAFWQNVGITPNPRTDIQQHMWSKFMLNCGVNQACAVYATGYGGAVAPGPARNAMLSAMREVMHIAQKAGILLDEKDIFAWLNLLATLQPDGTPSMRQDMLACRKTEVEFFAGTARRLGKQYDVSTPQNDAFYTVITQMEKSW